MGTSPYNCCNDECVIACDEFDRPDSTDLGSDWCEQSGDWEIVSEHLVGKTPGVAVFTRKIDPEVGYFQAAVSDVQVGCVYRLLAYQGTPQCPCESKSCWTLELAVTGGANGNFTGVLSLKGPSGDVSEAKDASIGSTANMSLCVGPERITGDSDASYPVMACHSGMSGTYFAVGNGSASQVAKFSSVLYSQHYSENEDCSQCLCGCEGRCLPDSLTATAVDHENCTNMDGMSWELRRATGCVWTMDMVYWNSNYCCMKLSLGGPEHEYGSAIEFGLAIWDPGIGWVPLTLEESRCDPLYLKFCQSRNTCETHLYSGWTCCEGSPPPPEPYGQAGSFCIEITE